MSSDPHDLLAAYALDALDDDEARALRAASPGLRGVHRAACAASRARRGPGVRGRRACPSEELRDRIIESARAEPRAAVIKLPRRNWALGAVAGVAAAAACSRDRPWPLGELALELARPRAERQVRPRPAPRPERDRQTADRRQRVADRQPERPGRDPRLRTGRRAEREDLRGLGDHRKDARARRPLQWRERLQPVLPHAAGPEEATVAVTLERAGGATSPTLPILFRAEAT